MGDDRKAASETGRPPPDKAPAGDISLDRIVWKRIVDSAQRMERDLAQKLEWLKGSSEPMLKSAVNFYVTPTHASASSYIEVLLQWSLVENPRVLGLLPNDFIDALNASPGIPTLYGELRKATQHETEARQAGKFPPGLEDYFSACKPNVPFPKRLAERAAPTPAPHPAEAAPARKGWWR